jgi:hypothetical protein
MTITPQALGSLIKRTGILKSADRKGNSYRYHTEGYTLTRQSGDRYIIEYYPRLQLGIRTESQELAFQTRRTEALATITEALASKGITFYTESESLWIDLGATNGN